MMGIKDKLKEFGQHLATPYPKEHESYPRPLTSSRTLPWPQQTPEQKERKQQLKIQKEKYRQEEALEYERFYHKGRVAGARKRGFKEGSQSGPTGTHGILAGLGKGMGDAGNYGLQMQDNIKGLFGIAQPTRQKKRK